MKVGVILPLGEIERLGRTMSYAEIRGLARQVEEAGFDSVWIYDHLLYRFPEQKPFGVWEGWTIMTALAEATERVEIGGLVFCTAFRNPAVLAKMAVTLDEVSGGRIILGLGCGWHEPEFDAFGLPFDHRVDRFEEACEIIVPLVKEGKIDFTGKYYSAPNCEMMPPPRKGGVSVLIASSKPRMHGLTAKFADSWNTAWLGQASALTPRREGIEAACVEAGRDPATLEITVGLNVAFPGMEGAPEDTSDPAKFLTGTADELAAGLQGYAAAGVGHVICNCMPVETETVGQLAEALARFKAPVGAA
ncbi:MAG: LLM class flavin-dependent oxidoreductase [Thermomicrobiales bacterium]